MPRPVEILAPSARSGGAGSGPPIIEPRLVRSDPSTRSFCLPLYTVPNSMVRVRRGGTIRGGEGSGLGAAGRLNFYPPNFKFYVKSRPKIII